MVLDHSLTEPPLGNPQSTAFDDPAVQSRPPKPETRGHLNSTHAPADTKGTKSCADWTVINRCMWE